MTMFAHPNRDCIIPEVDASMGMVKYQGLETRTVEQVAHSFSDQYFAARRLELSRSGDLREVLLRAMLEQRGGADQLDLRVAGAP